MRKPRPNANARSPSGRGKALARRLAAALLALTAILLLGCGGSETEAEKEFDLEFVNAALAQELTILDAYTRGLPLLRGGFRVVGRQLRAQEQEYVDALTKAIRGLGGEADAEAAEVDFAEIEDQADFLALAYDLENGALTSYVDASPQLFTAAPRVLASSLSAGHAQHLVVLRQGLGADLAASVPEAFESGEEPPPGSAPTGDSG